MSKFKIGDSVYFPYMSTDIFCGKILNTEVRQGELYYTVSVIPDDDEFEFEQFFGVHESHVFKTEIEAKIRQYKDEIAFYENKVYELKKELQECLSNSTTI